MTIINADPFNRLILAIKYNGILSSADSSCTKLFDLLMTTTAAQR